MTSPYPPLRNPYFPPSPSHPQTNPHCHITLGHVELKLPSNVLSNPSAGMTPLRTLTDSDRDEVLLLLVGTGGEGVGRLNRKARNDASWIWD